MALINAIWSFGTASPPAKDASPIDDFIINNHKKEKAKIIPVPIDFKAIDFFVDFPISSKKGKNMKLSCFVETSIKDMATNVSIFRLVIGSVLGEYFQISVKKSVIAPIESESALITLH